MRLLSDVASRVADPHLALAAALAERAHGATWPNPVVGCVIVSDGRCVGEGFHHHAGEAHAEVLALAEAGALARGATAYVTLEPCAHHGKTPPCVDALIAAGVARVVIGMPDPNPNASGGAEKLVAAGVAVEFAADSAPFIELNAGWLKRVETGMPLITVKSGISLDARVAFKRGRRASITGTSGALVTQLLRSRTDAVLVSAATIDADDPALTVRDEDGLADRQPLRVVLVREHVPRPDARLFTDGAAPVLVLAGSGANAAGLAALPGSVDLVRWDASGGLAGALAMLAERGVGELLVEPGPRLLAALWHDDLADRYVVVTAGGMVGEAPSVFAGTGDRDGDCLVHRMKPVEAGIVGDVSVTVWGANERLSEQ